jgi:hypothetical protein
VWRNSSSVHNYLDVYLRRAASTNKHIRDEVRESCSFIFIYLFIANYLLIVYVF